MSSDKMNKDFVTVSMMKEMLELQERAFKSAITMLVDDVRSEVRNLRKDVEEVKYSTRFVSDKYDDIKKNIKNIDNEITAVYRQIEGVNKEMNAGFEDLQWKTEYLENQSRKKVIKALKTRSPLEEPIVLERTTPPAFISDLLRNPNKESHLGLSLPKSSVGR